MLVERNRHGAYVVSATINNQLISRQYYDYTRSEAIAEFRTETKEIRKNRIIEKRK